MNIILDLKKFLEEKFENSAAIQIEVEQKFLKCEESEVSCSKPPLKKKKKLCASKRKDMTEKCVAHLAAQLQVEHFKQVSILFCFKSVHTLHDIEAGSTTHIIYSYYKFYVSLQ